MFETQNPATDRSTPWAVWPTLGISIVIMVWFILTGILFALLYLGWELSRNPTLTNSVARTEFMETLSHNGTFFAWNTLGSGLVGIGLVAFAIKFRQGWTFKDYLNLYWPKGYSFLMWNALLFALVWLETQIADYFSQESDFLDKIFASDYTNLFLLAIAVVVMASFFEEILFRGFMFKGLENSRLGPIGAIVVTSAIWTLIHTQYGWFFKGILFSLGLLLGYARYSTKSLWIPISMHAFNNGLAMASVSAGLHGFILS